MGLLLEFEAKLSVPKTSIEYWFYLVTGTVGTAHIKMVSFVITLIFKITLFFAYISQLYENKVNCIDFLPQ